jgi:hypothetical protein
MKFLTKTVLVAVCVFLLGSIIGAILRDPPKWALSVIDSSFYQDQCASGSFYGVRRGMTRRDVQIAFGMGQPDFRTDWYIVDESLGLPPDQLIAPVWTASVLPRHLMEANRWRALRKGYGPGFEMIVSFEGDEVVCADARYEVLLP